MKKIVCILILSFGFSQTSGGYPGSGFRYGTNAREISMGGAMNSVYNKGFNSFNNPALLSQVKTDEYGLSYFAMSLDRSIQCFSISTPMPPSAGASLSVMRVGTDDITTTNSSGNVINQISSYEGYGMLSFGNQFGKLAIGLNIKAFKNQLTPNYSSDGVGVDIGAIYLLSEKSTLGISIQNLSSTYNWNFNYNNSNIQYEETLPQTMSFGYSYSSEKFLISLQEDITILNHSDFDIDNEIYSNFRLGTEINMKQISDIPLFIRFGLKHSDEKLRYAFGCGVPFKVNDILKIEFNYALDPGNMKEGFSHLITFSVIN